ncbi:hypothetical protein MSMAT_2759 [Methanosarcina mazei TMA]|uniref:Uncharacterized protein n=1 Tax=Methanosarcina mazei C16 TaxID=1434113 RepID=A0A0E3S2J0_METMZ|nr:hypothetical protein MSMAC_2958 [Methanosarcina mazei C16]UWJ24016.1 hypothetical protein MSMAT_2759 [Methanosarcina mazei TMA]
MWRDYFRRFSIVTAVKVSQNRASDLRASQGHRTQSTSLLSLNNKSILKEKKKVSAFNRTVKLFEGICIEYNL